MPFIVVLYNIILYTREFSKKKKHSKIVKTQWWHICKIKLNPFIHSQYGKRHRESHTAFPGREFYFFLDAFSCAKHAFTLKKKKKPESDQTSVYGD